MNYQTKDFSHLIGLPGFSDKLLETHFKLYSGYVANTNKLIEKIITLHQNNEMSDPEFAELKRRFGWEFNGMRLHEMYFENLTKETTAPDPESEVIKEITKQFGDFNKFIDYFKATAAMRGIGWVVLYYDPQNQMLLCPWINEHDVGHLAGTTPLLVLDVFEHAFLTDYSLARADYIESFIKVIDWQVVNNRYKNIK